MSNDPSRSIHIPVLGGDPALLVEPSEPNSHAEPSGNGGSGADLHAPLLFDGRFEARRLLKEAQGVRTYRGTDRETGADVIVKTAFVADLPASMRIRLEHEAGVLGALENPSLASVLHVGGDIETLFVVAPHVAGVPLRQRLGEGPLAVQDAIEVGLSLMSALHAVHERGVLHRHLKPANVIVEDRPALSGATLVDFGLARNVVLRATIQDLPVATAQYMSPEQAGLLHHEVDERSDLYSAGAVLFECLAGRPPYRGETVGEVLRRHMTTRPPDLRMLAPAVPRALAELVEHLLERDPRDRYQSAMAAAADLAEISRALDRGISEPSVAVGQHDRRSTLTEPAFVGREREIAQLEVELAYACEGRPGVVLLEAESGGGKTRLLNELERRGGEAGAAVYRGQGVDQTAQKPFQVLDGVVRTLVSTCSLDPTLARELRERLIDHEDALLGAVPQLSDVLGPPGPAALGPEALAEARTIHALGRLLDALGSARRPALVLLDDSQWADELTLRLVRSWYSEGDSPESPRHVLIVLAYRPDEVGEEHPLRSLERSARIELPPLEDTDVRRLAVSMAGPLPEEGVKLIERLSAGSPFMASEALRGLVETGTLVAEASGWRLQDEVADDVRSSNRAAALIARRLAKLSPDALRLLSVGAVLGRDFDPALAADLADQDSRQISSLLHEARRRHIVWADAHGARCTFVHDKLREALLDRLAEDERRSLHRSAGVLIERLDSERVFEVAYHFDAAGESQRALPYALEAARRARSQHALALAESQCRIAERGVEQGSESERQSVAELLGDVLMLRGRYDEADKHLRVARELAGDEVSRAEIGGKLGELAFKRGDVRTAGEAVEHAVRQLGERMPSSRAAFLVLLVWEAVVQALHSLFPRLLKGRRAVEDGGEDLLAGRLYSRLAYIYWFHRGRIPCAWAHLREMNIAERYPVTPELAQAYSEHAPVMTMLPWFRRGVDYAQRSLAIRRELGDVWGEGQSQHFYGIVLYASSRFTEAIERFTEAVRLLERTGDHWEVNTARWHIALCLYRLGRLEEAVEASRAVHRAALELGDDQAAAISLGAWAKAAEGDVPVDLVKAQLRESLDDAHAGAELLKAEALRLLAKGRPAAAVEVLERAAALVGAAGLRQEYVAPVQPWLATALREQLEATPQVAPAQRRALLRRARRAARRGHRLARSYRNNLPHSLRELGLLAALSGHSNRARRLLDRSVVEAEAQDARFERALSLQARAQVGRAIGWADAESDAVEARNSLALLRRSTEGHEKDSSPDTGGAAPTLSLLDRFTGIVDWGRRIATALTREEVFAAASEAAVALLRTERSLILEGGSGDWFAGGHRNGRAVNQKLIEHALQARRPALLSEVAGEDPGSLGSERSALCAPIVVRGEPCACLYVTSDDLEELFGEEEKRLAEFIATLAGAALENAHGFAANDALSRSLRQRALELERSNADLQQFANAASHDLSEPLRMVSSYVQLLGKRYQGKLDEDANEFIGFAVDGVARMQSLIDGLLVYSRAGTAEYAMGPVDCDQIMREAVAALQERIDTTGAEVTSDSLPTVVGDATQFAQLFQNLLSNAIKFATAQPRVHVSAERRKDAWLFTVTDNGIGIPREHAARIFIVFQRLHGRDSFQGSGIGLAICKRIVERHDGEISVEPVSGGGSRFAFTIPDREDPDESAGQALEDDDTKE